MNVDAVVVGSITDYAPYYPPRVGMQIAWYSPYEWKFVQVKDHEAAACDEQCECPPHESRWRDRCCLRCIHRFPFSIWGHPTGGGGIEFRETSRGARTRLPGKPLYRGQSPNDFDAVFGHASKDDDGIKHWVPSRETGPELRFTTESASKDSAPARQTGSAVITAEHSDDSKTPAESGTSNPPQNGSSTTPGKLEPALAPLRVPDFETEAPAKTAATTSAAATPASGIKGPNTGNGAAIAAAPMPASGASRKQPVPHPGGPFSPPRSQPPGVLPFELPEFEGNFPEGAIALPTVRPPAPNPLEPLMSYTRMFDGTDAVLVKKLRDYVELNGDLRSGGWRAYLYRSEDFIRFTSHRMIVEMLTLHGGEGNRRVVFKLRKHK
jgi:hypothetical protein